MKQYQLVSTMAIAVLLLVGCKSKQSLHTLALSPQHQVVFLDSLAAADAIIKDDKERFFDQIGLLDMSIQMKKPLPDEASREEILSDYRHYLRKDVLSFTPSEKALLEKVFKKVYLYCNKLSPNLLGPETKLIKTHGTHYGSTVYYTRENCIVIPKFVLTQGNEDAIYGTMLHELFHIYSRYHEPERNALYALIGYKDIGPVSNLQMDSTLKKRLLLNPDGVDYGYAIKLETEDSPPTLAIPIIKANTDEFLPSRPAFFSYLDFALYKISPPFSRLIKVHNDEKSNTTITSNQMTNYLHQIKDNTNYIIHPDEILADNFMYLIRSKEQPDYLDNFSPEGRKLIEDMGEVLGR